MIKYLIWFLVIAMPLSVLIAQEDLYISELDSLLSIPIQTSSKYWRKANESASSVTIITSGEIAAHGYKTLDEVLSSVRSFYISYDRNYTYLGVRGFGRPVDYNNRILLLLNGHTINEGFFGSMPIGTDFGLDLDFIDRIEIVRGPGSALYGSGAMFAVINIVTKQGLLLDGGRADISLGSYGRRDAAFRYGTQFNNGLDITFSGTWADIEGQNLYFSEFDSEETNHGIAERLDWDRFYNIMATARYGGLSLQGFFSNREKGIPTAAWDMNFNDRDAQSLDSHTALELKYRGDITPAHGYMIRGYYDGYYYRGAYPYEVLNTERTLVKRFGSELQMRWDLAPTHRLLAGMEYVRTAHSDFISWFDNIEYFNGNFPYTVLSAYIQDELELSKYFSLVAGLRQDIYSSFTGPLNPRIGAVIHPFNASTVKLLAGRAFRAPNNYEMHYSDPDWIKPNPDVKPELITTYEFIWEQRLSGDLLGSVSIFHNDIDNLIEQMEDPDDGLFYFSNILHARAQGIEFEFLYRKHAGLHATLNYAYQKAVDLSDNSVLSNSPEHILKSNVSFPVISNIRFGSDLQYHSTNRTVYDEEIEPFLLVNVFAIKQFNSTFGTSAIKPSVSLRLYNVFNEVYGYPGGFEHIQRMIIQNGRHFIMNLTIKF